MSSPFWPASRHQPASPSTAPFIGPSRNLSRIDNPARSRHFQPIAAASIAALLLSACGGGGDGAATSAEAVQSEPATTKFESFISANPQVRAMIQASPYGTKDDDLSGEDAKRAAAADDESDAEAEDDGSQVEGSKGESAQDDSSADDSDDGEASSSGSSGNIVDTLISDMSEMNDLPLKGVNPKYGFARGPGYNLAGTDSGGANYVLPWFVQFEGEGNGAWNTRVEMRNLRLFVKSHSTGEWSRLINSNRFSGIQCDQGSNYFHCPQQAQVQDSGDSASTLPLSNLNLHGWWGGREPIESWDMAAMVISLDARVIKNSDGGVDDRSKAKYLIQVGADYYPTNASHDRILEAVGVSRAKLVTSDWQTFTFSTLGDVGKQEPGGGISSSDLRKNPPPLN
jgi:hypothetical protein